ncbi:SDR family NAD(P)-dependent oxidoreductase [Allokutzneria oryzae]|uniref:SDR family NAD(P)-dependent oxidoreductase n=1 Tax=Allokutzneria oryzae TaxID=1378989 RepID=A0ABV5ZYJ9_9PSEU
MTHSAEPIAIVGIGCRLPGGVTDRESLWRVLTDGVDAIGPIPPSRWDVDRFYAPKAQQPGRMNAREGGFLDEIDTFDAAFFGISGRVAEQMDPQQRLLLEVSWEALEDAGVVPDSLAGGRTGVFVGACSQDYGGLQSAPGEVEGLGPHSATGTFMSIVSNRLSYTLDLRGPSMTIDTACSSSLVAVHLACESLRRGESELALAAGVNVMLTPQFAIALSQAAMLSPDARSRAFDSGANGYARGEGAGVVVLKPLSKALADNDRVYAVIQGSAVNQDGRTQGITLPSGEAQEANFRDALRSAGIAPSEIGYVEAHGTGTPVGDPIEANALGRVLREDRAEDDRAYIGSIKTNIGHLEAGAGIAGLIKATLSVYHRSIPPSLHFRSPNPDIDFDELRVTVPTEVESWPQRYPRALAAVNSFGFGGTNANVVVGEAPTVVAPEPVRSSTPAVITLSARNATALGQLAERVADRLEREPVDPERLAAYLALRRAHHGHRIAVIGSDTKEIVDALRARATEETTAGGARGKIAFLYNGQGPQWYAMGRRLLETSPVYREKILECDRLAQKYLGWSIYEALTADEASSRVNETQCLQPTMFALQVALTELWKSWGVVPDAVLGHSMGEIAAAHVSGALDLDTALRVICHRSRIQENADPTGGMMFVALGKDEALELCERHPGELWLSAENSPRASTLSGRIPVLEALVAELGERGVFARVLKVNCACHSQDMDPLREELLSTLDGIACGPATIPMYSTVLGARIDGTELGTDYWWRNFRQPVLFEPGIRALVADGVDTFVELSPHPVLANSLKEITEDAVVLASLVRKKDDWSTFLGAFADLYTAGHDIDWTRRHAAAGAVDLPTNPWVRESYWNESEVSLRYRAGGQEHPMLKRVDSVRPTWEIRWDDYRLTWVKEHDVFGSVIVPGASYVEAALVAARELTGETCGLDYVAFERACVLDEDDPQLSRIELNPDDGTFQVHHRSVRGSTWVRAVHGRFHRDPSSVDSGRVFDLAEIRSRCLRTFSATDVYGVLRDNGYRYGPTFCGIDRLQVAPSESLARIVVPRVLRRSLAGYLFHPAVLDACFQSGILHPVDDKFAELLPYTYLPTSVGSVRLHGDLSRAAYCHTLARKHDVNGLSVDIHVLDENGKLLAEYVRLEGKVLRQGGSDGEDRIDDHLYRLAWQVDREARGAGQPLASAITVAPTEIAPELSEEAAASAVRLARHAYATDYQRDLKELCAAYVVNCLVEFGVGEEFGVDDLPGLQPRFRQAMTGYLRFLAEDGVLSREGDRFRGDQMSTSDIEALWSRVFTRHPSAAWELLLLRKTGTRLHEVLTGAADPLELLFPAGSQDETEPIYQSSPVARLYNLVVKRALERFVASTDPRRTLRVLEVGGGTGGLTVNVLGVLPPERTEYVFTDVSAAFAQAATERFADYGFVTARTLDLERDLEEQGIKPGSFDIVLASDVVHATSDLKRTLFHLQDALAPGGVLGLIEAMPGNRQLDLTFGLTTGWWAFRDLALRKDGPLLDADAWQEVLRSSGYTDVVAIGDPGHTGAGAQAVLLARTPVSEMDGGVVESYVIGDLSEWLVVAEPGDPLGAELADRINGGGGRAILAAPGDDVPLSTPVGVVKIVPNGGADAVAAGAQAGQEVAELLQALEKHEFETWPRLFVLTRGAQAVRSGPVELGGSFVWGLGTVAGLEYPQARCTMIDLAAEPEHGEIEAVWNELMAPDTEREVALRAGTRFVRRLLSLPPQEVSEPVRATDLPDDVGYALELGSPGALDELNFVAVRREAPGPGQVEIEVVAAGLNFLDLMTALDQVPALDTARSYRFGAECAGVVTRVGAGVGDLGVGDAVIAVSSTQLAIASHVTLDAVNVVGKPDSIGFEEAASTPIVFLTAWYALERLARIRAGERVLIHSATGGTGLAAIQIARRAGAEVFATAGTPEKRALLRSLGVEHVMDSRSLDFVAEIRRVTGGAGVDVVLNSLTGEAATRSLDCLAPYGRFVEIGKRDLLDDRRLGLRPFLRNLAYLSFDLRQLIVDRPGEVRDELARLAGLFATGELTPLPHRVFHARQAEAAFRQMAAARHIGKLVIAMDERDLPVVGLPKPRPETGGGTWLITGGLGGLGLAMADALAESGVEHLVLLGRSGASGPESKGRVDALRARGVEVVVESADVGSREELAGVLDRIARDLPPLAGVLHCAMVLDDALLSDLDRERLDRVVGPKALGAWHLHELTAHLPLRAFVLFSSAAAMIGNRGQANYAAANMFLDHLAEFRVAQGLPGLAVNWGAVSDAGYVARHSDVARVVASTGMRDFTAREAYRALSLLWVGTRANAGVLPMDWPRFFQQHGFDGDEQPRYAELYDLHGSAAADQGGGGSLRQRLRTQLGEARGVLLREVLRARVATVLGMPLGDLDEGKPLMDYLDSLLAVEISSWLERELGAKVTIMELMKGPSVAQLAEQLLQRMPDSAETEVAG